MALDEKILKATREYHYWRVSLIGEMDKETRQEKRAMMNGYERILNELRKQVSTAHEPTPQEVRDEDNSQPVSSHEG